jgi:hypothetical protein
MPHNENNNDDNSPKAESPESSQTSEVSEPAANKVPPPTQGSTWCFDGSEHSDEE